MITNITDQLSSNILGGGGILGQVFSTLQALVNGVVGLI